MHSHQPRPLTPPGTRRGFTLIELLIVIVILGVLAGLLFPAISAARRSAQIATVKQDIHQLESAITSFKNRFGMEPPSRISIYEDGTSVANSWNSDPRSRAIIRKMWPQFDFSTQDRNFDGDTTDILILNGGDALIFFLGGVIVGEDTDGNGSDDVLRVAGFSKNPQNPFLPSLNTLGNAAGNINTARNVSESRDGPFFEFSQSRLVFGVDNTATPQFKVVRYLDPIPTQTEAYGYLNSEDYKIYDPAAAGTPSVYKQNEATGSYYKPETYQIVSPGFDGLPGHGGVYEIDDSNHDGTIGHINYSNSTNAADPANPDNDNITNFAPGTLRP